MLGFCFSKGHRIMNVPTDPYLPYLFDGEEISMTTRLWTHGYDLYMPDRDIIYHIYEEHHKRPLFWNDDWNKEKRKHVSAAQNRINYVLQLHGRWPSRGTLELREVHKYSLGTQRDINDYWQWIQMDFEHKTGDKKEHQSAEWCPALEKGGMERMPTKSEKEAAAAAALKKNKQKQKQI